VAGSVEHQRDVTRLLLRVVDDAGFALAGSGAIREHGVSARPTEDVDLFTTNVDAQRFDQAIDQGVATLHEHGYRVVEHRRAEQYVRLNVTAPDGHQLEVDFGIDWRAHEPVRLDVGPVLALPDAVANKVGALYSRAEVRDYLDVDAIRQSGRYTDEQLLDLATEHDPGFERPMFASLLARVRDLTEVEVIEYGVSPDQLTQVKQRLADWSTQLRVADQNQDDGPAPSTGREVRPSGPESAASSRKGERGRPSRLTGVRNDRPPAPGENRARGYRR
jgi:hypothetical protein